VDSSLWLMFELVYSAEIKGFSTSES